MNAIKNFTVEWLIISIAMMFLLVYEKQEIGINELIGTLIGAGIGCSIWRGVKWGVGEVRNINLKL